MSWGLRSMHSPCLKHCAVFSLSVMSTLCNPVDCSLPDSSVHGDSPNKNTRGGCHALLQGSVTLSREKKDKENPTVTFQMTCLFSACMSLARASHIEFSKEFGLAQREVRPFLQLLTRKSLFRVSPGYI